MPSSTETLPIRNRLCRLVRRPCQSVTDCAVGVKLPRVRNIHTTVTVPFGLRCVTCVVYSLMFIIRNSNLSRCGSDHAPANRFNWRLNQVGVDGGFETLGELFRVCLPRHVKFEWTALRKPPVDSTGPMMTLIAKRRGALRAWQVTHDPVVIRCVQPLVQASSPCLATWPARTWSRE